MTTVPNSVTPLGDPGGPVVGVCAGGRCAALWRLRDDGSPAPHDCLDTTALTAVRRAVATTPGGVLTRLECMGACAEGALVAVAHRRPDTMTTGEVTWVVGAEHPERHAGLLGWITTDWTAGPPPPPADLSARLVRMVRLGGDPD